MTTKNKIECYIGKESTLLCLKDSPSIRDDWSASLEPTESAVLLFLVSL